MARNYADNFGAKFLRAIQRIEDDAAEMGLTMSEVARRANSSRLNILRWKKSLPTTVECLVKMEDVLRAEREARRRGPAKRRKA